MVAQSCTSWNRCPSPPPPGPRWLVAGVDPPRGRRSSARWPRRARTTTTTRGLGEMRFAIFDAMNWWKFMETIWKRYGNWWFANDFPWFHSFSWIRLKWCAIGKWSYTDETHVGLYAIVCWCGSLMRLGPFLRCGWCGYNWAILQLFSAWTDKPFRLFMWT